MGWAKKKKIQTSKAPVRGIQPGGALDPGGRYYSVKAKPVAGLQLRRVGKKSALFAISMGLVFFSVMMNGWSFMVNRVVATQIFFMFIPKIGEGEPNSTHIFQMG